MEKWYDVKPETSVDLWRKNITDDMCQSIRDVFHKIGLICIQINQDCTAFTIKTIIIIKKTFFHHHKSSLHCAHFSSHGIIEFSVILNLTNKAIYSC